MRLIAQAIFWTLVIAIEPQARITNKMLFLVDCSGSMTGEKLSRAIDQTIEIAGQETDDLQIACIAFDDGQRRWPGGWAKLPDPDVLVELRTWLNTTCRGGNTPIAQALIMAMQEPVRDMTLIIVSDGFFDEETGALTDLFKGLQEARVTAGLGKVVLVGVGISPSSNTNMDELRHLVSSAEEQNGGYFIVEPPPGTGIIGPH